MPLCSTACSWNCVYVHLYKQGICKGARACGEKAGVPEASQTAADREGADRLPGVDLQSRSVSQVNKIFINTWHVISPQNHQRCSCVFLAPENDLHCNHQKASVWVFCPLVLFLPWLFLSLASRISSRPRWEPMYLCLSVAQHFLSPWQPHSLPLTPPTGSYPQSSHVCL